MDHMTHQDREAADPHAGRNISDAHASHDRHAGHSVAMFRDKFWLSFALTTPVVFWSTDVRHWLGYTAPSFPGSDAPQVLEYNDTRWELEASGGGTRLTLWNNIDRRFIAMGAAGWHICFDVLDHLLSGTPIGRIVGSEAMKFGWQRLNAEYAKQFGLETPKWPPQPAQKS